MSNIFTSNYPEEGGFVWVDEDTYAWSPSDYEDDDGNTRDFLEVASGWHVGMDAVYSLHSYWFLRRINTSDEVDIRRFVKTVDKARATIESYLPDYDVDYEPKEELFYMLDTLDGALSVINPSILNDLRIT